MTAIYVILGLSGLHALVGLTAAFASWSDYYVFVRTNSPPLVDEIRLEEEKQRLRHMAARRTLWFMAPLAMLLVDSYRIVYPRRRRVELCPECKKRLHEGPYR